MVAWAWDEGSVAGVVAEGWAKEWDEAKDKAADEAVVVWARVVAVVRVLRTTAVKLSARRVQGTTRDRV